MNKYKVRVEAKTYCTIEVIAENDAEAVAKAEDRASWGQSWPSNPSILSGQGKVIMSGPIDEPLLKFPEDWQIYSSMKGSDKVNAKITAAVRMACADLLAKSKKGEDIGPKYVRSRIDEYIEPLFKKYREYGTYDSEPYGQVRWFLARYASELGGGNKDYIYDRI